MSRNLTREIREYQRVHGVKYTEARRAVLSEMPPVSAPPVGTLLPTCPTPVEAHETMDNSPWTVMESREKAAENYPMFAWSPGVLADGTPLRIRLADYPHLCLQGPTGSGKSYLASGMIDQLRAGGFQVLLSDVKGLDCHSRYLQSNVSAVGPENDALVPIYIALNMLRDRFQQCDRAARENKPLPLNGFTPVALVVNDFNDLWENVSAHLDKRQANQFLHDIEKMLRHGRQLRVHVIVTATTLTGVKLPPAIRSAFHVVHMGTPSGVEWALSTYGNGNLYMSEYVRDELRSARGRGVRPNLASEEVELFQAWWLGDENYPETLFRDTHMHPVPPLHPRLWLGLVEEGEKVEALVQEQVDKGGLNLMELGPDVLGALPVRVASSNDLRSDPLANQCIGRTKSVPPRWMV